MAAEFVAFAWVKSIRRNWVLIAQGAMGVTFYAALGAMFAALFVPTSWHLSWVGVCLLALAFAFGGLERWLFFNFILCPSCGFNATHGKSTDRPLQYDVAWSRLEQYQTCPRCGRAGHA